MIGDIVAALFIFYVVLPLAANGVIWLAVGLAYLLLPPPTP